jgi:hypothetical protein
MFLWKFSTNILRHPSLFYFQLCTAVTFSFPKNPDARCNQQMPCYMHNEFKKIIKQRIFLYSHSDILAYVAHFYQMVQIRSLFIHHWLLRIWPTVKLRLFIRCRRNRGQMSVNRSWQLASRFRLLPHTPYLNFDWLANFGWKVMDHHSYYNCLMPKGSLLYRPIKNDLNGKRFATDADVKQALTSYLRATVTKAYFGLELVLQALKCQWWLCEDLIRTPCYNVIYSLKQQNFFTSKCCSLFHSFETPWYYISNYPFSFFFWIEYVFQHFVYKQLQFIFAPKILGHIILLKKL